MPNLVNQILYEELENDLKNSGSFLFLGFDKLTVQQDGSLRNKLREAGVTYRVVKNRLAAKALKDVLHIDIGKTLTGKCGMVSAPEARAIEAAKVIREAMRLIRKDVPVRVLGGVVEGEAIVGAAAETIADMPDRNTVNAQVASALIGPARMLASVLAAVPASIARAIQAKIDKEQGGGDS
ncbi:MAG: 50S ribosomal protein L10 [Planctomycetes bacterium]|nr:50S ribosomal protein L10 [Planctomycetota bacterium]